MMTIVWSASLTIQGNPPRPVTTANPNPAANQDLGDLIRNSIQDEISAGRSRRAGQATTQPTPPTQPTQPAGPRVITITGKDGTQTITLPPHPFDNTIPPQAVDMTVAFFLTVAVIIIGLPLARAFARRLDRRGGVAQIPNEVSSQLAHLNQAVDAIALEVERISEGQRFTTRLLSEQRDAARQTLPAGTNR
jgi:hypothetical protein